MLCCNAYDLFIKTSPITPVSNKMEKLSDFPLILIIHRETICLFEISTELAGAKINAEIKKRDGPCKRLDAKITLFLGWVLVGLQLRTRPVVGGGGCKCFRYEINSLGKLNEFMVESSVTRFAIIKHRLFSKKYFFCSAVNGFLNPRLVVEKSMGSF